MWFVVSLTLLYGIFKKHCFHLLFIVHSSLYKFLASAGLAQARPNKNNAGSHNSPGYYWITSRVYCGMNYEWKKAMDSGVSFCHLRSKSCSSAIFSTNGTSYQRVCGRARGYQRGGTSAFYGTYSNYNRQLIKTMFLGYQSLIATILASIFGLMQLVTVKIEDLLIIVLVPNIQVILLLLL